MRRYVLAAAILGVALLAILLWLLGREVRDEPRAGPARGAVAPAAVEARGRSPRSREEVPEPAPAESTAPPAPAWGTCIVQVVAAEDSKPFPDAEVVLEDAEGEERRATAGASGAARFDRLPPGSTAAWAYAPDRVRSDVVSGNLEAGAERTFRLVLARGAMLEGVVLDARDGRGVAGAAVEVIEGGSIAGVGASGTSRPPLGRLTTGPDGRFRVAVPAGEMVSPTASARGYVAASCTVIVPAGGAGGAPVELRLEPCGRLLGTVTRPDGLPAAGARVYVVPADYPDLLGNPDGAYTGGGRTWSALLGRADAQGRYDVEGLVRGGAYIAFAAADGLGRSAHRDGVVTSDEAPVATADFVLRRLGSLVVRLVGPDGLPTAGHVRIVSDLNVWPEEAEVGAGGALRREDVGPTTYRLHATAPACSPVDATAEVPEGGTAECVIRLARGCALAGVVVDDRGEPVSGAQVQARRPYGRAGASALVGEGLEPSEGTARSGADGRFRVEGLRPGPHVVTLMADGHAMLFDQRVEAPAENLRLVIRRRGSVRVRIVVPEGCAPPDKVYVSKQTLAFVSPVAGELFGGSGTTVEFGDGRHTFAGIDPGTCRLHLLAQGFARTSRRFTLEPGQTLDLGEIALDPGVDLPGRVEDLAGAPIPGAQVRTGESFTPEFQSATTGTDGGFRLRHLAAGPNEIAVEAPGFLAATVTADVAPGGAPFVVRLGRGALLRVAVVTADGKPVPAAYVEIRAAGASDSADPVAEDDADHRGVFETRLPAGRWRVSVRDHDETADVELVEGSEMSARLVLR